jgi:hypothetical protein
VSALSFSGRHCEERSDVAIQEQELKQSTGLLRFARNDGPFDGSQMNHAKEAA